MNGKSDWLVRGLLLLVVLLVAAQFFGHWRPPGRYVPFGQGEAILDTATGTLYVPKDGKVASVNLVELSTTKKAGVAPKVD